MKNRVHTNYTLDAATRRPEQALIANSDREALRANILPLLAASPSRGITLQLASTLKTIVAHDFPERWPGLIAAIKQLLTSNDIRHVHAGCVASLESVRAFRFVQKNIIYYLMKELSMAYDLGFSDSAKRQISSRTSGRSCSPPSWASRHR
jgi:hypothetical protein